MNISISGNLKGPTIIFLAGWPDTSDVFRSNLMAHLEADYRIVGLTLPGYDGQSPFLTQYWQKTQGKSTQNRPDKNKSKSSFFNTLFRGLFGGGGGSSDSSQQQQQQQHDGEDSEEPMRHPRSGYSFSELTNLLEIAVDTAMENHNYCPTAFFATSLVESDNPVQGMPAHQLPPYYPRPVLVAHGWGCVLAYELILSRPALFSRIVALDVGACVFEHEEEASGPTQQNTSVQAVQHSVRAASMPSTPYRRDSFSGEAASGGCVVSPAGQGQTHTRSGSNSPNNQSRSLASRYAIRKKQTNANQTTNTWSLWQKLCVFLYQLCVIVTLIIPACVGRVLLRIGLHNAGRPPYEFDPRCVVTEATEKFNHRLYHQHYYRQHYYYNKSENRPEAARCDMEEDDLDAESSPEFASTRECHMIMLPFLRKNNTAGRSSSSDGAEGELRRITQPVVQMGYSMTSKRRRCQWNEVSNVNPYFSFKDTPASCIGLGSSVGVLAHTRHDKDARIGSDSQCGKTDIYYKTYFFPPLVEKEGGSSARPAAGGVVRSITATQPPPSRGNRQPRNTQVDPQPRMGWIYLRFWIGVMLCFIFSKFPVGGKQPQSQQRRNSHANVDEESKAVGRDGKVSFSSTTMGNYSPLMSQRFFFPIPTPVLYMYGGSKRFMLHSDQWCDYVKHEKYQEDGISDVVEVHGGGHWFFAEKKYQRKVAERIADFIASKTKGS